MTDSPDTRRATRRSADGPSTLRGSGSGPHDSWVHDVSQTGMRIECLAELAIGEEVRVGLSGAGATLARIVWRKGNQYGCDFIEPLGEDAAATAFNASPVVSLSAFASHDPGIADADVAFAPNPLFEGEPSRGRFWMAGFAVAIMAVAMPAALVMARLGI